MVILGIEKHTFIVRYADMLSVGCRYVDYKREWILDFYVGVVL